MKTLFILPLFWLLTGATISKQKSYGEIIINDVPEWRLISVSGNQIIEINMPELTSDFIAKNKIKVSLKFWNLEGYKTLPYIDNQSASPGAYDYSLAPLKLTCTFAPRATGGANGSELLTHVQVSFNFSPI